MYGTEYREIDPLMNTNESNIPLKKIVEVKSRILEPVETGIDYRFPNNIILSDDNGVNLYNKKVLELLIKS